VFNIIGKFNGRGHGRAENFIFNEELEIKRSQSVSSFSSGQVTSINKERLNVDMVEFEEFN